MKRFVQAAAIFLAFVVLAGILYGLYRGISAALISWSRLDATVATLAVVAVATTLLAVRILAIGRLRATQWEFSARSKQEREALYHRIIQRLTESDTNCDSEELRSLQRRLALTASPLVLESWMALQSAGDGLESNSHRIAELINVMRKDLGVSPSVHIKSLLAKSMPR